MARAPHSEAHARAQLRERLQVRRGEIEEAVGTRVASIADPGEISDPAYAEGLRASVAAAVEYAIEAIAAGEREPPIPIALLAQARMAARVGIPLDTVLRRYFAGYSLIGYFILEEATRAGLSDGEELKRLLGAHAGLFDRLLAAVGEEYAREGEMRRATSGHQAESVRRLLEGEPFDSAELGYELEGWHIGLVAKDLEAEQAIRQAALGLGCRVLCVSTEEGHVWAWCGTHRRLDPGALQGSLARTQDDHMFTITLGEAGENLAGWRFTHRQAVAALTVAAYDVDRTVRYGSVALSAAACQDELLGTTLFNMYLRPLLERTDGHTLTSTLTAYFNAEKNISSTAVALGVSRQTVRNRLASIEDLLGGPLTGYGAELEVALRHAEFFEKRFQLD